MINEWFMFLVRLPTTLNISKKYWFNQIYLKINKMTKFNINNAINNNNHLINEKYDSKLDGKAALRNKLIYTKDWMLLYYIQSEK